MKQKQLILEKMPTKMRDKSAEFTDYDSYLFHEGTHYELYRKLGTHPDTEKGVPGTRFNVWAPHAEYISLITSATGWENEKCKYPCLYKDSKDPSAFEWVNREYADRSVISYIRRRPGEYTGALMIVINFSPFAYEDYSFGAPCRDGYRLIFSSCGSPAGTGRPEEFVSAPRIKAVKKECDGYPYMLSYDLRPFEALIIEAD